MSFRPLLLAVTAATLTLTWQTAVASTAAPETRAPQRAATTSPVGMLAYAEAGRIHTIRTDGSHRRLLARGEHPAWSPDGRQIAYERSGVRVMSSTGDGNHRLTPDGSDPAWSPDGQTLSFVRDGDLSLYHLGDRSITVVVPRSEEWPGAGASSWSPDGQWIAFERLGMDEGDGSSHRLFRVRSDGTSLRQVAHTACVRNPSWSPDGQRIAFGDECYSRGSEETGDVRTIHPDGTGNRPVLRWGGTDEMGSWSPDGSRLVVTSEADWYPFQAGVWTMSPDGTHRALVVRNGYDPDWRPGFATEPPRAPSPTTDTGPRIAYVAASDNGFDLFTVRPDGTGRRQLTHNGLVTAPAWSPDHRRLAFFVQGTWKSVLWLTRADGSRVHRILVRSDEPYATSWSPDGRHLVWAGWSGDDDVLVVYGVHSGVRRIVRLHGWWNVQSPSMSPDGRRIAFSAAAATGNRAHIVVVRTRGGLPHAVINLPGVQDEPSWSANGRRLTFTWTYSGRTSVVSMTPAGRDLRYLAMPPGVHRDADWSPTGSRLAMYGDGRYQSGTHPRAGLWTVDAHGRHPHFVVRNRSIAYIAW